MNVDCKLIGMRIQKTRKSKGNSSEYRESEFFSEIHKLDARKRKYILEIIRLTNEII